MTVLTRSFTAAAALLTAFLAAPGPAAADALVLQPHVAEYEVRYGSRHIGDARFELVAPDSEGTWRYESSTKPRGLAKLLSGTVVESSRFSLRDGEFVALGFESDDGTRKGKRDNIVTFDRGAATVTSRYEHQDHVFPLTAGLIDRSLVQLALMRDLCAGRETGPYTIIDRDRVSSYLVEALEGEESIETGAGTFVTQVLRQQREGSSRHTLLWTAPQLGFLPVRMIQKKGEEEKLRLDLVRYEPR